MNLFRQSMAEEIKLSKFDNEPWGFRLTGGKDFGTILTIIKVSQGSLAEKAGLRVGDLLLAINDEPLTAMTHSEAHEAIVRAGNNFVFTLVRGSLVKPPPMMKFNNMHDNTEQQMPIETSDEIKFEEEHKSKEKEEQFSVLGTPVPEISVTPAPRGDVEELEERVHEGERERSPEHELQEIMLGHAQVISGNAMGVDFYKMAPQCEVIEKSEVLQAIKEEKIIDAKKTLSTFLQQPDRPVVKPKQEAPQIVNSYKPIIKILRKGQSMIQHTETDELTTQEETEEKTEIETNTQEENNTTQPDSADNHINSEVQEVTNIEENELPMEESKSTRADEQINNKTEVTFTEELTVADKNDIDAQLLKINEQLANLMCIPQEMQRYLLQVKEQITQIIQLKTENEEDMAKEERNAEHEVMASCEPQETYVDNQASNEVNPSTEKESPLNGTLSQELPDADQLPDAHPLPDANQQPDAELPVTEEDYEGVEVKEDTAADPLTNDIKQQQEENKPRRDIKWQKESSLKNRPFFPLTPKPRPIVVPGDVHPIVNEGMFSDDFIAETLTGNAEVILGRTIGNNFLKFKKNYDHLQLSSVYKMVHQDDISVFPSRSGKIPSQDDYIQPEKKTKI